MILVSKKAKPDTWSIFFSTRCRTSDKNKIDQVSDLAVFFLPAVVFDELSCSTKGFSARSRASGVDRPLCDVNVLLCIVDRPSCDVEQFRSSYCQMVIVAVGRGRPLI